MYNWSGVGCNDGQRPTLSEVRTSALATSPFQLVFNPFTAYADEDHSTISEMAAAGYGRDEAYNASAPTVTVSDANNWSDLIEGLDVYDEYGQPYYYGIEEVDVPEGFTVRTSDPWNAEAMRDATQTVTLTATNTPNKGHISVTKSDVVDEGTNGSIAANNTFTFTITEQGSNTPLDTLTVQKGGTATSVDLDLNKTYVIEELTTGRGIDGYVFKRVDLSQTTVTLTSSATVNVTATNYYDKDEKFVEVHDSVTVNKQDDKGSPLPGATFTLYATRGVNNTLSDVVDTYTSGAGGSFTINTEDAVLANFLPTTNGGSVTLYLKETNAPTGYLLDNTIHNVVITAVISGPTYDSTEKKWVTTTSYTMTIDNAATQDIDNTPETIDIPVSKEWLSNSGTTAAWPTGINSVTVTLYRGETSTGETLQLTKDNNSTAKFTGLPKYDFSSGTATLIDNYRVVETAVNGYTSEVTVNQNDGFTVTNTPKTTQVTVDKNWTDSGTVTHDNDWVKVKLYRNGADAGKAEETLNKACGWTKTWTGLPVVDDVTGQAYTYAVVETGYRAENGLTYTSDSPENNPQPLTLNDGVYTVTINNTPGKTIDVEAVKTWTGGNWPADVTVSFQLKQNGTAYRDPVSVDATTTESKASWTGLPKADDNGANYAYTVDETVTMTVGETTYTLQADTQYTAGTPASSEEDGKTIWTINNTFTTVDVPVKKVWTGDTPLADAVRFTLTANSSTEVKDIYGNVITSTVKLDAGNNWTDTTTFVNLPRYTPDGNEIEYRLAETSVLIGEDKAENWRLPKDFFTVMVQFNPTTRQWEIENTRHEATITIAKVVKGTSTALKGAIFQIKRQLPNETAPALFDNPAFTDDQQYGKVLSIQEEGAKVDISGLLPGIYTVTEVKAPSGYIIMASSFTFTIAVDGTVTYSAEGNDGNGLVTYTPKGSESYDTFTVGNEPGVALPATGGVGTGVVYGAGAALMLLAVLGLILTKRKRTDGEGIR